MTGATSGTGMAYPSGAPDFLVNIAHSLVFCVVFY